MFLVLCSWFLVNEERGTKNEEQRAKRAPVPHGAAEVAAEFLANIADAQDEICGASFIIRKKQPVGSAPRISLLQQRIPPLAIQF